MYRTRDVELVPLFGGQVPPEEEALKLSQLIRSYKNLRGVANLQDRLISMVTFMQSGVFVNGARAPLNKVIPKGYGTSTYFVMPTSVVQPRNGAPPFHACFLMTGVCAYSYLFSPAQKSFSGKTIIDHRLGLYPLEFEYQRALSYIGNVAKKYTLRYSFTSGILAFSTKTEASSEANSTNFGASPKKSAFHRHRTAPTAQSSAANPVLEHLRTLRFPAALAFQDKVPVFDARGTNFITGQFDLTTLHSLPLITTEVDESSVVTVGYTCNTYVSANGNQAGFDVLSTNIQFVIVHAGPPPSK
ncbi:hypothetical protein NMY22_g12443 [Coprinellus aureogranulatus]|nr:hypothetical protein NMY22_g12443 [Coprinellus aureogranulatus]